MTVFSLSCLLKYVGAVEALQLAIDGFELVGQLMEHADSAPNSVESVERLGRIEAGFVGWLASETKAKMYPTDFGVAVAWNRFHLLNFGDTDEGVWYSPDQLKALEEGQEVEGYKNGLHYLEERFNTG